MARLLASGYDMQSSLDVIQTKKNIGRIEELKRHLLAGDPLIDHFMDNRGLQVHFQFFYSYTSLANALKQSIGMYRYEENLKKKMRTTCFYPSLIVGISILSFFFMASFIVPMMTDLLDMMDIKYQKGMMYTMNILSTLLIVAILVLVIVIGLILYHLQTSKQVSFFYVLNRYWQEHVLTFFHSYVWAGYWLEFQKQGCSTLDAITYIKHMNYRVLSQACAIAIDQDIKNGISLVEAMKRSGMLTETLCLYFDLGSKTQQLSSYLETYLEESRQRLEKVLKTMTQGLQLGSYVCVGMIVVMMVQILFAPLDLLSQL